MILEFRTNQDRLLLQEMIHLKYLDPVIGNHLIILSEHGCCGEKECLGCLELLLDDVLFPSATTCVRMLLEMYCARARLPGKQWPLAITVHDLDGFGETCETMDKRLMTLNATFSVAVLNAARETGKEVFAGVSWKSTLDKYKDWALRMIRDYHLAPWTVNAFLTFFDRVRVQEYSPRKGSTLHRLTETTTYLVDDSCVKLNE